MHNLSDCESYVIKRETDCCHFIGYGHERVSV